MQHDDESKNNFAGTVKIFQQYLVAAVRKVTATTFCAVFIRSLANTTSSPFLSRAHATAVALNSLGFLRNRDCNSKKKTGKMIRLLARNLFNIQTSRRKTYLGFSRHHIFRAFIRHCSRTVCIDYQFRS